MRVRTAIGTAAAWALLPATASAASLELRFTTDRPATASGLHVRVTYPEPSPIASVRVDAPSGTRIVPDAVPLCTATDAELRMRGLAACRRESRIGHGVVVAETGVLPGSTTFDAVILAAPRQLLEVVLVPGTEQIIAMDRLHVDGATLTAHPPATPGGPPDFRTNVREVRFLLAARPLGAPPVVTTPPACPEGRWTALGTFGFADGSTARAADAAPCATPARKAKRKPKRERPRRRRQ